MRFDKTCVTLAVASAAWLGACEQNVEQPAADSTAKPGVASTPTSAAKTPVNDATEPAKENVGKPKDGYPAPAVEETASPGEDQPKERVESDEGEAQ